MSGSDPLSLKAPYSLAKAMDHEGVIRLFHLTTVKGLTAVAQGVARLIACLMIACSVPAFAEGGEQLACVAKYHLTGILADRGTTVFACG